VSRFFLGTINFGPKTSELGSFVIMDRAHELDFSFSDTADVYGWQTPEELHELTNQIRDRQKDGPPGAVRCRLIGLTLEPAAPPMVAPTSALFDLWRV